MAEQSSQTILQTESLVKHFNGLTAISDLSFSVGRGQVKSIIGPNGAGKTTLINLITGVLKPSQGQILFKGRSVGGLAPFEVSKAGVSRTFQTVELFGDMTALENVMVGCHRLSRHELLWSAFRLPGVAKEENAIRERSFEQLKRVGLADSAFREAGTLPLGDQKLLEIARALASQPELLLLDEPAAGLNEVETQRAAELIQEIRQSGVTIILVEHDMKVVMSISDEVLVINYGARIAEGPPEAVKSDPKVIEAYLGRSNSVGHGLTR
ncbi:MAG: ABC transporter ATP-binding protein [Desulfarculaceae bacterium]|jgi:branched-chain amino acid transport system ATP-binding protein